MPEEEFARDNPGEYALIGEADKNESLFKLTGRKTIIVNPSLERISALCGSKKGGGDDY
jgi:hypothetical protein